MYKGYDIKKDAETLMAGAMSKGMLECEELTVDGMRLTITNIVIVSMLDLLDQVMGLPGVMDHIMSGNGFPDEIRNDLSADVEGDGLMGGAREEINDLIAKGATSDIIKDFILDRSQEKLMEILPDKLTDEDMMVMIDVKKELDAVNATESDTNTTAPEPTTASTTVAPEEVVINHSNKADSIVDDANKAVDKAIDNIDKVIKESTASTSSSGCASSSSDDGMGALGWCAIAGAAALVCYGGYKLFSDGSVEDTIVIDLDNAF